MSYSTNVSDGTSTAVENTVNTGLPTFFSVNITPTTSRPIVRPCGPTSQLRRNRHKCRCRRAAQMRLTSKLIRAADQAEVWSATFDNEPDSLLEFQRDLCSVLATQIHLKGKTYKAKRGGPVSTNRCIGRLKAFYNPNCSRKNVRELAPGGTGCNMKPPPANSKWSQR
jgi:hypothetical protein